MATSPLERRRTLILGATAILLLALGLRLAALSQEALWADEQYTLNTAGRGSLAEVLAASRTEDPHPPLYFLLLHLWIRAVGDGDAAVRLPSVLAGFLAVGLVFLVGRRLWPDRPGRVLAAGGLAAVSPFLVYYSQEARSYSLLVALELVAIWAFLPAREGAGGSSTTAGRWGRCLAGALAALAAMATHHFGFLIAVWSGFALLWLLFRGRRERPWPEGVALGLLGAGAVPSLVRALGDLRRGHGLDWLPDRLVLADVVEILGAQVCGPIHAAAPRPLALGSIAIFALALAASALVALRGLGRGRTGAADTLLLLALALLFAAPVVYSLWVTPILWYGNRYLIVAVPIVLLVLLGGLEYRGLRQAVAAALVLHLVCAGFYLHDYYRYRQKRLWDVAAAELDARATPADGVTVIPGRLAPLLDRYLAAPLEFVEDGTLLAGGGPERVWLLATGDLREEILSRTGYRIAAYEVLQARGPGALHLHELVAAPRQ